MTRANRLYLRLSDDELAALKERANELGISPANYARQRALGTLRARGDAAVIRQLVGIGNNINQIARNLNAGSPLVDDLAVTLKEVREAAAAMSVDHDHDKN